MGCNFAGESEGKEGRNDETKVRQAAAGAFLVKGTFDVPVGAVNKRSQSGTFLYQPPPRCLF
jgi:hypothetical protein